MDSGGGSHMAHSTTPEFIQRDWEELKEGQPGWETNQVPSEYKYRALPLYQVLSHVLVFVYKVLH